mmetsp:Transcript_12184/g.12263  ORF Transcript_12184/g.12263 Transcript_12184/m.12263 type:complete len:196 (-) Transcript_12184:280-867(-)
MDEKHKMTIEGSSKNTEWLQKSQSESKLFPSDSFHFTFEPNYNSFEFEPSELLELNEYLNSSEDNSIVAAGGSGDFSKKRGNTSKRKSEIAFGNTTKGERIAASFCHICGRRNGPQMTLKTCGNFKTGSCRKVVCERCIESYNLMSGSEIVDEITNVVWKCPHCVDSCPARARCHSYKISNQKRYASQHELSDVS